MVRSRVLATAALVSFSALAGGSGAAAQVRTGTAAYGDFQTDAPGVVRKITPADLTALGATPGVASAPVGPKPEGAAWKTRPGFTVAPFAKLDAPRRLALCAAALACTPCLPLRAQDEAAAKREGQPPADLAREAGDWTHDAPGTRHRVDLKELPPPYSTNSAVNGPKLVPRPDDAKLQVPAGFQIEPYATGLQNPRYLLTAPNGDIFVAETSAGKIVVLRAKDGATKPDQTETFAEKLDGPFGIAFYPASNPQWVYVATVNAVARFPYRSGDLKARGPAEVVIPQLADTRKYHSTRDILFSPDGKRMYVSVGSGSNVAEEVAKKTPEETKAWAADHALGADWGGEINRADVLTADPDGKNLKVYAAGIRNCVGLAIQPKTADVWCATNERDLLGDDLPPDYVTRVKAGGFYGWPWYYIGANPDPRPNVKDQRPDLADKVIVPDVLLQPHSAPLQEVFYTATSGASAFPAEYRGDLFVALHGSWNRSKRTGYKVARVILKNGVATGEYEDFITGFAVDNKTVWGRPVGVAVAHDGALLFSDDGGGMVWRVSYAPATR